jgi:predicted GNAT family N-acyltransferase
MNDIDIAIVNWLDKQAEISSVRRAVFVEEQNVPESIDFDGSDVDFIHVLASDTTGRSVGTARMDGKGKIGRMAVLQNYRRRGIGRKMIQALMDYGRKNSITGFHVSSQITAVGFYEKMDFGGCEINCVNGHRIVKLFSTKGILWLTERRNN